MVAVVKFSEFIEADLTNPSNLLVGLTGGLNSKSQKILQWATPGRPNPPLPGILGYNVSINLYEFWNGSAWVQLSTGGSGTVTEIDTINGITGGPIINFGTISLAAIAHNAVLANISGASLYPSSTSVTALLDSAMGDAQGDILYRNATNWTALPPGIPGQFLMTQGPGFDVAWGTEVGVGTVISIATNNGITGGTITVSGTIGLANVSNGSILSNISGGVTFPTPNTLTAIMDALLGSVQGDIIYRNGSIWTVLPPGINGQILTTSGPAANPSWQTDLGTGTVTSIATNNGLTGGTITTSGTLSLAAIANNTILANISGGVLFPSSTTVTALLDAALGSAQGNILYRNSSVWAVLAPGTAGQFLQTGGPAANPSWQPESGTGSVTNIATGTGLTGGPITTTGTISLIVPVSVSNGGTGRITSTTAFGLIAAGTTATGALQTLSTGVSGQILQSGGSGALAAWSTTTYPATNAINTLLYASATNVISALATANNGVLATDPSGVPSIVTKVSLAPTIQSFTVGSGTYTRPAGVVWIKVKGIGGGGGGGGGGTAQTVAGGTGGTTTFGSSLLTGIGGGGGSWAGGGGSGGTASLAGGAIGMATTGGTGQGNGQNNASGSLASGGMGGNGCFGGSGGGGGTNGGIQGIAGTATTGGGGGGGATALTSASYSGSGGGAGGWFDAIIVSPSATYAYVVGAGGTAGTANYSNGAAGGTGFIIVEEHYI